MKQIIKPGTKQIKTCENCGCKFSFEQEDIVKTTAFAGHGVCEAACKEAVMCPQCDYEIILKQTR